MKFASPSACIRVCILELSYICTHISGSMASSSGASPPSLLCPHLGGGSRAKAFPGRTTFEPRFEGNTVRVELVKYLGVFGKFCFLTVMTTYPTVG